MIASDFLKISIDQEINLQERFLTGMVRQGVLELHFPEVRNWPDQAYRTVANLQQER